MMKKIKIFFIVMEKQEVFTPLIRMLVLFGYFVKVK